MTFISRRDLLKRAAAVGGAAVVPRSAEAFALRDGPAEASALPREPLENLTAAEADILDAVVARLIPTDANGPGATEARAAHYIDRALGGALAPSLGRNLSGCAPGVAACNQTRTELLIAPLSRYEPRVQQVDLRFSKSFPLSGVRAKGNIDLANLFNTGNVLAVTERYGPAWLNVLQTIGGRMIKFSTQIDF